MSFVIARDGRICHQHIGLPALPQGVAADEHTIKEMFEGQIKALL